MGINLDDVTILGVSFPDEDWVDISFVNNDDVGPDVQVSVNIRIRASLVPDMRADVLSDLRDLVQAALVKARNPVESFTAPR